LEVKKSYNMVRNLVLPLKLAFVSSAMEKERKKKLAASTIDALRIAANLNWRVIDIK
jgi:hypothetical protein